MKGVKLIYALFLVIAVTALSLASCAGTGAGTDSAPTAYDIERDADLQIAGVPYKMTTVLKVQGLILGSDAVADISDMSIVTVVDGENFSSVTSAPMLGYTREYTLCGEMLYCRIDTESYEDTADERIRAHISDEVRTDLFNATGPAAVLTLADFDSVYMQGDAIVARDAKDGVLGSLTSSILDMLPEGQVLSFTDAELIYTVSDGVYSTKEITLTCENASGTKSFVLVFTTVYEYDLVPHVSAPSDWYTYTDTDVEDILGLSR